jgi:hypothetical protein
MGCLIPAPGPDLSLFHPTSLALGTYYLVLVLSVYCTECLAVRWAVRFDWQRATTTTATTISIAHSSDRLIEDRPIEKIYILDWIGLD